MYQKFGDVFCDIDLFWILTHVRAVIAPKYSEYWILNWNTLDRVSYQNLLCILKKPFVRSVMQFNHILWLSCQLAQGRIKMKYCKNWFCLHFPSYVANTFIKDWPSFLVEPDLTLKCFLYYKQSISIYLSVCPFIVWSNNLLKGFFNIS